MAFLRAYLFDKDVSLDDAFWVMPDQEQSEANGQWIKKELGLIVEEAALYVAPRYAKTGPIEDPDLCSNERARPKTIFIQLGGGQERLGFYCVKTSRSRLPFCVRESWPFFRAKS